MQRNVSNMNEFHTTLLGNEVVLCPCNNIKMVGTRDPQISRYLCMNDINRNTYIGDIEILSGIPDPSKGNYNTLLILLPT